MHIRYLETVVCVEHSAVGRVACVVRLGALRVLQVQPVRLAALQCQTTKDEENKR